MIDSENVIAFFKKQEAYILENPIIELRTRIVNDLIGDPNGLNILDIGCGDGSISINYLKNNKITFLDITPEMLDLVKARISNEYIENVQIKNISVFDFNPNINYDIIVCMGVLAHVSDPLELIKKIESLLTCDGIAVIQFTNKNNLISILNKWKNILLFRNPYRYTLNRHSIGELNKVFLSLDFTIIKKTSYWSVSPFFSMLRKTSKKKALFYFYYKQSLSKLGAEKIYVLKRKTSK
jgi:ubiquinone/menaquinone biosynthesis C-methylase UbiE